MIILKMRASFGKLNGEMTLHEGLNLLCMPNESGKSTWSAFLLAMLYGIDTKEKASSLNQNLPAKERYKPWDGRNMQGAIELIWKGRSITIERKTQGRVPMGVFEAYDTLTGTPIPELTADNCGLMLCGVERNVFERTAFIRQLGLNVSEDHALEKRLNTLVTTGEEGKSASELAQTLHDMRVKLSRPSTGRISRLRALIDEANGQKNELYILQDQAMDLQSQVDAAQAEFDRLDALTTRIEQAQNARKQLALQDLESKQHEQALLCARLKMQASALPEEAKLHSLSSQLDSALSRVETAQLEHAFCPEAPQKPQPPSCFAGLDLEEAKEQYAADCARFEALTAPKSSKKLPLILCAIALAVGIGLVFVQPYLGIAVAAIAAILAVIFAITLSSSAQKNQIAADHLLEHYGVSSMEQVRYMIAEYATETRHFEHSLNAYQLETQKREKMLTDAQKNLAEILAQVRLFAPNCTDAPQAKTAISSALRLRAEYLAEQRTLDLQINQLASMRQILGTQACHRIDAEALTLDAAKIAYDKNVAAQQLSRLQQQLAEKRGMIAAHGDIAALQAQLEEYHAQLKAAEEMDAVVAVAEAALSRADETLRSRFSPQITAEAGAILSELTENKYPFVSLKPDMTLSVREASDTVTHPAAAMSCGTSDQMYLALRLAMVHRLLDENAPILLDDALVNFDDRRTAAAVRLLTEEAKNRQVILFTCKEISHVL